MRNSIMDFTRGSQIVETVAMMFTSALKPMLLTALAIAAVCVSWQFWKHTETGDSYFWIMHLYARAWLWMGFAKDKLVGLKTLTEGTVMVHMTRVDSYPPLSAAWSRLTAAFWTGSKYGLALGLPLAFASTFYLRRYGRRLTERTFKRGAQLASAAQLATDVERLNDDLGKLDRAHDLARIMPLIPRHKRPFVTPEMLLAHGMYLPYRIAGISYPWRAEQSHAIVTGTTGVGKSTVIKDLLQQVRARRGRAVVFDITGTYIESFYNPDTDIILNPFDARCPKWSPFSDAETREHFKTASLALVPAANSGDKFWLESARMLFVETCVRLVQQRRATNTALADVLMTSDLKVLHKHVLRTVAGPLTDPEAKRMAESIRATFNTYAQALMTLPTEGEEFSVRKWVEAIDTEDDGIGRRGSILFIATRYVELDSLRTILTLLLSTVIHTLMSLRGDQRDLRLWFMLDEIGALHNVPAVVAAMQTARNYGGALVLGVHTMQQLKETYGDNLGETIASLASTKILMRSTDETTKKWESDQIGEGEWTEMEENWSYGASNIRDAATLQRKIKLEPLVLPTQFAELPNLLGYLKFPEGLPAALVKLTYVRYAKPNTGFVPRKIAPLAGTDDDVIDPVTGEILDPSGEGYQAAFDNPPKERTREESAREAANELTRTDSKNPDSEIDITLDPRATSGATASRESATASADNAASSSSAEAKNRQDTTELAAKAKIDPTIAKESVQPSLVVQEQLQSFGTGVDPHHIHDERERRVRDAEVELEEVEPPVERDQSWGYGE